MKLEIQVLVWNGHKYVAELNKLIYTIKIPNNYITVSNQVIKFFIISLCIKCTYVDRWIFVLVIIQTLLSSRC